MEINIKPEDVESVVKDTIIRAGLGKAISEGVAKALGSYNSPVDQQLKEYMSEVAGKLIRERFSAQINQAVSVHIEAKVTAELIDKLVGEATDKMVMAANRY